MDEGKWLKEGGKVKTFGAKQHQQPSNQLDASPLSQNTLLSLLNLLKVSYRSIFAPSRAKLNANALLLHFGRDDFCHLLLELSTTSKVELWHLHLSFVSTFPFILRSL